MRLSTTKLIILAFIKSKGENFMKKALLALVLALCLMLAFSVLALAQDGENTYYVVQSEGSELATTLKAEGKSVVGIERLYSSRGDSLSTSSTYFLNQFDGEELNLILAENVSYAMGTNPSNPTGSGIRLDKAITLNVYFNGYYWWIPDDNRYAGFFIANEGATLSLIGERSEAEVAAAKSLTSQVNAKTTSNKVDYYGGYIGFYLQAGSLNIKNAVIVGEDEVIYQKKYNGADSTGNLLLHLENTSVYCKDGSCNPIVIRADGAHYNTKIEFDRVYTAKTQIYNILPDSYIRSSQMAMLEADSWRADSQIGLDYFYVSDSKIGDYITKGDTQHIVATNTEFARIDLKGDSSGGAYATLINSTYTLLNLKRNTDKVSRNGTLYVLTLADCENASTKTDYNYDDATSSVVVTVDTEYSKANPALGHTTDGEPISVSYESYLKNGSAEYICSRCGTHHTASSLEPLFFALGYSYFEGENGGISAGFRVNSEAIALYEQFLDSTFNYGVFAVSEANIGNSEIFNEQGEAKLGVISTQITEYEFNKFEIKIVGFLEAQKDLSLAMGAYVEIDNGETKNYSYLQSDKPSENQKYAFVSYNGIKNSRPTVENVVLDDIEIEAGTRRELPKTALVGGEEKPLTYTFVGEGISIDGYELKGLEVGAEATVYANAEGYLGTFNVRVTENVSYKHVVIIGVDGAGTYFKNAETPNIDKIFENGAITYECLTSNPTISAQCWGSLIHGVEPSAHKLTNAIVQSSQFPTDSKFPSFFRVIRENDENAVLASFTNWNPINVGIVENGIDVHKVGGIGDRSLTNEILSYLEENSPTAMFVQFDEADGTGHSSGYGSQAQLTKISELDSYIGEIYSAYEKKGIIDQTLFIVTADHGGNGTSHGGLTDGEKYVMFAATGKTVQNGTIENMEIRDTAAIVLHALGYQNPETWTAIVPSGLFKGVIAGERPEYVDKDSERYHESVPTPEKESDGYVTKFVDNELKTYLTFDNTIADSCGASTSQSGNIYFVEDGYFGEASTFDDGYVTVDGFNLGDGSFTMSLWIKTDGVIQDPCIISNKDWNTGKNHGFTLTLRENSQIGWNFGDGANRADLTLGMPQNYREGWVHVLVLIDRENNKLGASIDFGEIVYIDLPTNLQDNSFNTKYPLTIGQDGTGKYNIPLPAALDEVMVFDGAFTQSDVNALASYYGVSK